MKLCNKFMKCTLAVIIHVFVYISAYPQNQHPVSIDINDISTPLYQESYALIIGEWKYNVSWPDLPGVKNDIEKVKTILAEHNFKTIVVENPSKPELDQVISDFISQYAQDLNNRILIYFAGHGHTIETSYNETMGYIVPSDAPNPHFQKAKFKAQSIPMSQIEIYAKQIESKHALFIFDACFSGSIFNITRAIPDVISYKTVQPVRQFISSGSANESVPDKSIFCEQFLIALSSSEADANKDGYLTGSELGEFFQTNVTNYSYNTQHPQYGKIRNPNLDKGDFVFVLNDSLTEISANQIARQDKKEEPVDTAYKNKADKKADKNQYQKYDRDSQFKLEDVYLQFNSSWTQGGFIAKPAFLYTSKFLKDRYFFGFDFTYNWNIYNYTIQTFPTIENTYSKEIINYAMGIYNKLYLFPQKSAFVNFFLGTSLSWNNWQFEAGIRPIKTKRFAFEIQAEYFIHNRRIRKVEFNQYGNSNENFDYDIFSDFYFGLNIQYYLFKI